MICSGKDTLVDGKKLVETLQRQPRSSLLYAEEIPDYEHLDLIWANDAKHKVFPKISELITSLDVHGQVPNLWWIENSNPWIVNYKIEFVSTTKDNLDLFCSFTDRITDKGSQRKMNAQTRKDSFEWQLSLLQAT